MRSSSPIATQADSSRRCHFLRICFSVKMPSENLARSLTSSSFSRKVLEGTELTANLSKQCDGAAQVYHPSNIACRNVHSNSRNLTRAKHHLPAPCSRPPSSTHRRKAQGRPRAATPDMVVAGVARTNHQLKTALSILPQIHPPRSRERNQNGRSFGQMQVACPAPNAPTQRTSMADPSERTHHSPQGRRVDRIFGVSVQRVFLGERGESNSPGRGMGGRGYRDRCASDGESDASRALQGNGCRSVKPGGRTVPITYTASVLGK